MKIAFGADHGGINLKAALLEHARSQGHLVTDCGAFSERADDYPDYAARVAEEIIQRRAEVGVLICRSGIGMSIAANKIPGIRAALAYSEAVARVSRKHNHANVICFGADYVDAEQAKRFLTTWLETGWEGGRHQRRVNKINQLEEKYCGL
jgi:RpiB/LacA/LacB family sugar-phosphate isomerase